MVHELALPKAVEDALIELTPRDYVGLAPQLARSTQGSTQG
jgi:hypothetical protein